MNGGTLGRGGYFVGVKDAVGDDSASSAQLKRLEAGGSASFLLNTGEFSIFWCFSMKPADFEGISNAVMVAEASEDSYAAVGGSDFKTARDFEGSG